MNTMMDIRKITNGGAGKTDVGTSLIRNQHIVKAKPLFRNKWHCRQHMRLKKFIFHHQEALSYLYRMFNVSDLMPKDYQARFILIRREDSHFNEAKRSKWEMNRLNYILLKIG